MWKMKVFVFCRGMLLLLEIMYATYTIIMIFGHATNMLLNTTKKTIFTVVGMSQILLVPTKNSLSKKTEGFTPSLF